MRLPFLILPALAIALGLAAAPRPVAADDALQRARRHLRPLPQSGTERCESGHWLQAMYDGHLIRLDDNSLWEIDALDRLDTSLWTAQANIIVCPGKLINTDETRLPVLAQCTDAASWNDIETPT